MLGDVGAPLSFMKLRKERELGLQKSCGESVSLALDTAADRRYRP